MVSEKDLKDTINQAIKAGKTLEYLNKGFLILTTSNNKKFLKNIESNNEIDKTINKLLDDKIILVLSEETLTETYIQTTQIVEISFIEK